MKRKTKKLTKPDHAETIRLLKLDVQIAREDCKAARDNRDELHNRLTALRAVLDGKAVMYGITMVASKPEDTPLLVCKNTFVPLMQPEVLRVAAKARRRS